jgi:hypothetical protein
MDWIDKAKKQREEIAQQNKAFLRAAQDAMAAAEKEHRSFLDGDATHLKKVVQRVEFHVRRAAELGLSSAQNCEGYGISISVFSGKSLISASRFGAYPCSIDITPRQPGFCIDFFYRIPSVLQRVQVRKRFKIEAIADDRVLQWLQWLATGEGKPWRWWGYQTRVENLMKNPREDRWGPWQ